MVVDFEIKYVRKQSDNHLIQDLQKLYTISIDWSANFFCGITLSQDYIRRSCDVSMPSYIPEALHKFQHLAPAQSKDAPHSCKLPVLGSRFQYAKTDDPSPHRSPKSVNLVQQIIVTLFYYPIAVETTILVVLVSLAAHQSQGTKNTYLRALHFLYYAALHPDATIRYVASDMVLHAHSNASYLSDPKACSRDGIYYFLGYLSPVAHQPPSG